MAETSEQIILIVEDDPSLREGIHDLLELEYNDGVHSVSNGLEALELLESITPNLIISDIMMPKMNGYELLKKVREMPHMVRIPFIFLTARGTREEVFEGRKSGAELYVTKPFDSEILVKHTQTQLKRSSEKQLASQEVISSLKRNVLQILNHEFRTPLTYVTAYYDMLAESIESQKDGRNVNDYLNGILSGCDRLINLIEDLILVMDVRSGRLEKTYDKSALAISDFRPIIDKILLEYAHLIKKYNIDISLQLEDGIQVWGVEEQLHILFAHLIENAVKFSGYSSDNSGPNYVEIKSTASTTGRTVMFEINDNGIGIPKEAQPKIFDLFYQHNRNYFEQQGSGAGLTISRGIANIHGGNISVLSLNESGCNVTVQLPIYKPEHEEPMRMGAMKASKRLAKILLVEDDEILLQSLEELMVLHNGNYHFQVKSATNGRTALEVLESFTPDIIVSDVMMPEMDGLELLKRIREQNALLHVPFIIVSARSRQQDVYDGRLSGAEEYITKPYDIDEFITLVEVQLDRYFQYQRVADKDFDNFKQKILSMLRPDFRDPLMSVSDSSIKLTGEQDNIQNADDLRIALDEIKMGSHKISELVEDFMALAEIETGEAKKAFSSRATACFDLNFLIDESIKIHREGLEANRIFPNIKIENGNYGAMIEHSSMQKAISRLIGIVTSFCKSANGDEINIGVSGKDKDALSISIWHNGENLAPEVRSRVHEISALTSGDSFNPMDFSSHLKIVAGFVAIHDGELNFKEGSSDENIPDEFVIKLPKLKKVEVLETDQSGFMLG
ncbi:MAG: response regulator [Chloroflexota bacterium]